MILNYVARKTLGVALSPIPGFITVGTGHLENSILLSSVDLSNVDISHYTESKSKALMSTLTSFKKIEILTKFKVEERSFSKSLIFTWELELYYW